MSKEKIKVTSAGACDGLWLMTQKNIISEGLKQVWAASSDNWEYLQGPGKE